MSTGSSDWVFSPPCSYAWRQRNQCISQAGGAAWPQQTYPFESLNWKWIGGEFYFRNNRKQHAPSLTSYYKPSSAGDVIRKKSSGERAPLMSWQRDIKVQSVYLMKTSRRKESMYSSRYNSLNCWSSRTRNSHSVPHFFELLKKKATKKFTTLVRAELANR